MERGIPIVSTCSQLFDGIRLIHGIISPTQDVSSVLSFSVRHKRAFPRLDTTLAETEIEIGQLLDKCEDEEGVDKPISYETDYS